MNEALYNAYSARITSSLALDMLRRRTLIAWHSLDAMDWTLEATEACDPQTRSNGRAAVIRAACAYLPEEHYPRVLELRAEGYSHAEIAQRQGRTPHTLLSFLARAGERLWQHYQTLKQQEEMSV